MVKSITAQNFKQEIEESSKPVILDCYATWCGPCIYMMPTFEEAAKELGDKYTFAKLNVDEARDIAIQFAVTTVPTFLFIKNGEVVDKEIGTMNKEDLENRLQEVFG